MQYVNNLRKNVFYRERKKKKDLVFKKPFFKRYIWKKGGSSYNLGHFIFGSVR